MLKLPFITRRRMHERDESQDAQWRYQIDATLHSTLTAGPLNPNTYLAARRTKCEHVYERPIAIADHRAAQHFH